jgi:hypothetical protein
VFYGSAAVVIVLVGLAFGAGRRPLWSPDGRMIAFRSSGAGNVDVYIVNADGSGQRNLRRTPGADEVWFAWSPVRNGKLRKRLATSMKKLTPTTRRDSQAGATTFPCLAARPGGEG